MAAAIPSGEVVWGLQLPVQSQSTLYVQEWEAAAGPAELALIAVAADRAGAFYTAVCDHVAIPRPADETMSTTWYDTVATLGWLASQTSRTHLLSHVYVLAYRHPLVTAKSFTTLDHLSGGRAILGVGAGHLRSEFDLLGVDHAGRGAATDESIEVIRAAFDEEYPVIGGPGAEVGVGVGPRPVRVGGPPIWVGGSSVPAMRRAARLGDGWLPQGPPEMGMRAAVDFIRSERSDAGRPEAFDMGINGAPVRFGPPADGDPEWVLSGAPEEIASAVRRYRTVGANQIQVRFLAGSAAEYAESVERFGADVWPLVAD
ncbi:MAG: TIGR03619 family F420-dependent LLM class oxidoreductase [Actinobacteria bacterium]|nr:TIGR03619 family F420-dependent LLM class oxidoreductase [Actinomycetota bacterium]